jgi:hypothetical protein
MYNHKKKKKKNISLIFAFLVLVGISGVKAQESLPEPCSPECQNEPKYAMHSNGDVFCCRLTTNELNSCTGNPC